LTAQVGSFELSGTGHRIVVAIASRSSSNLSIESIVLLDEGLDCGRFGLSSKLMEREVTKGSGWRRSSSASGSAAAAVEESCEILVGISRRIFEG